MRPFQEPDRDGCVTNEIRGLRREIAAQPAPVKFNLMEIGDE
jgi:hypothetical protein